MFSSLIVALGLAGDCPKFYGEKQENGWVFYMEQFDSKGEPAPLPVGVVEVPEDAIKDCRPDHEVMSVKKGKIVFDEDKDRAKKERLIEENFEKNRIKGLKKKLQNDTITDVELKMLLKAVIKDDEDFGVKEK